MMPEYARDLAEAYMAEHARAEALSKSEGGFKRAKKLLKEVEG